MSSEPPSIRVTILRPGTSPVQAPHAMASEPAIPTQTPLIDIFEGQSGLILEADLPGVNQEDVVIQLDQNVLTLFAKFVSSAPEGSRVLHEEYPTVDYLRSFILTDDIDRDGISAEMNQGVLRLNLPKAPRSKPRRIEIRSS